MKAQERHELQQNDLIGSLAGLYVFIRRYGIYILLALAVAALAFELIKFRQASRVRRRQEAWIALRTAQTPREIQKNVIAAYDIAPVRAQAYLKIGEIYLSLLARGNPPKGVGGVKAGREQAIRAAEKAFTKVLAKYPSETLIAARAQLGLAMTCEDAGQWIKAAAIYRRFLSPHATPMEKSFAPLAAYRLNHLKQWQEPLLVGPPVAIATRPAKSVKAGANQKAEARKNVPTTQPSGN